MFKNKSLWEMDELRIVIGAMVILSFATALLVMLPYFLLDDIKAPDGLKPYTKEQLVGRQVYIANGCVYCHSQQLRDPSQGPDEKRGWGRASVAGDYKYLFNIGARQPSKDWHLGHLYQPRAYTPGSTMPAYPFLFELRNGPAKEGEEVVNLPPGYVNEGQVVIAKPEAIALVQYLQSLNHTYPALSSDLKETRDSK
jgi:cytochrome c oxidase cbb3-type subunit 2